MRNDGVIGNIGRQDWMEPAEEGLQKLIHQAFEFGGGRHAKNFLHGTWLGEPLHVILTDVPIGAWTAAIVFDALDSMSPRRQYSIAADTAVALGLAGAIGAAATGLTGWQDIDPPSTAHRSSTWIASVSITVIPKSYLTSSRQCYRNRICLTKNPLEFKVQPPLSCKSLSHQMIGLP